MFPCTPKVFWYIRCRWHRWCSSFILWYRIDKEEKLHEGEMFLVSLFLKNLVLLWSNLLTIPRRLTLLLLLLALMCCCCCCFSFFLKSLMLSSWLFLGYWDHWQRYCFFHYCCCCWCFYCSPSWYVHCFLLCQHPSVSYCFLIPQIFPGYWDRWQRYPVSGYLSFYRNQLQCLCWYAHCWVKL